MKTKSRFSTRFNRVSTPTPSQTSETYSASSTPRTDLDPELLAAKPWLRFYQSDVPIEPPDGETTLPQMLHDTATAYPDHPALIYFNHQLSYKHLDELADRFAAGLEDIGVLPGDRIALLLPNCPQFVIAYYGALRAGAIVIPCNPLYTERELETQLGDSGATVLVTLTMFYKTVKAVRPKTALRKVIVGSIKDYFPLPLQLVFTVAKEKKDGHRVEIREQGVYNWLEFINSYRAKAPDLVIKPDDIGVYQYTGGTTGVPKAAMLSHRNLVGNAQAARLWMGEREKAKDVCLAVIPFFHVYGMSVALNASIYSAGTLILLPRFTVLDVLKTIEQHKPNLFPGVPAMYNAMLNHPALNKFDLKSIEICVSGAAPLPVDVQTRFEKLTGAKVVEGFGMTEASPITHCNPVHGQRKEGSIGLPFPGVMARIVDLEKGLQELPPGETGELVVSGPMVMQGYYNRPDETALTLRNGWLYTGDIARMDEDGYFYIVDRKKDMILSNGFNVYPRDVEEVLYQHPAVREAVVIGAPTERGDEMVKAFVVLKDDQSATAEEILAFCRERLVRYKVPRQLEFRRELPKTLIGKHLRRVLVEEERKNLQARQQHSADQAQTIGSTPPNVVASAVKARSRLKLPFHFGKAG
jgi:long-chain acyl-CoA synthetase